MVGEQESEDTPGATAGAIVADRYVLDRALGEGGMGSVWAARHRVTGKRVAVKLLKRSSPEHRRRFIQEARVAAAIRHVNVVEVHDILETGEGGLALVMDLLEGESLSALLERDGAIEPKRLLPLALPILAGLGAAHAVGVVHRDLKPDNIFLVRDAATGETTVKLLDFGIAKLTEMATALRSTGGLTQTGSVLGTPHYMAPEQVFGEKSLDHRADFWSLGIVLYECLSGACPIQGDNVGQLFKAISLRAFPSLRDALPHTSVELTGLVDAMLSLRPEDRPASAGEIAAVLADLAGVARPSIPEPTWAPNAIRSSLPPTSRRPPLAQSAEGASAADTVPDATRPAAGGEPRLARRRGVAVAIGAVAVAVALFALARRPPSADAASGTPSASTDGRAFVDPRSESVRPEAPLAPSDRAASTSASAASPLRQVPEASQTAQSTSAPSIPEDAALRARPVRGAGARPAPAAPRNEGPTRVEPTPTPRGPGGIYGASPYE
jgi:serine/threonine protein kinase